MAVSRIVILASLLAVAAAIGNVAKTLSCKETNNCSMGEVRIDPCTEGASVCALVKGENATISFDFTPNFTSSNMKTGVYYRDIPFSDLGTGDACQLSTCPTVPGQPQLLTYNLYIGKKLPPGNFKIKWKVWDADNEANVCCFHTSIRIPRK